MNCWTNFLRLICVLLKNKPNFRLSCCIGEPKKNPIPLNLLHETKSAKSVKRKEGSKPLNMKFNLEKRRKVNHVDSGRSEKEVAQQEQEDEEIEEIRFYVLNRPVEAPHMQMYENHDIVHDLKGNLPLTRSTNSRTHVLVYIFVCMSAAFRIKSLIASWFAN